MQDISGLLTQVMKERGCSAVCALFSVLEDQSNGIHISESKSTEQISRRLRDKSDQYCIKSRLG